MITVDDLKPAIGAFGDPHAVTPNMDRLAARGTVFVNAHCQKAVCAPSRVSVLTGLRPDTTRVWDLKTKFRPNLPGVVTLPEAFKRAGYHTAAVGKVFDSRSTETRTGGDAASWSEPYHNPRARAGETFGYLNPASLERLRANLERLGGRDKLPAAWPDRPNTAFGGLGQPMTDRAEVPDTDYQDGMIAAWAAERLERFAAEPEQPFFLAVGFYKPHLPFNAPERYWAMYDREALPVASLQVPPIGGPRWASHTGGELRRGYGAPEGSPLPMDAQRELVHGYYACVSYIDAQVGRLLDTLEAEGLAENTVVVLWGDHGFHLGDHAIWCKHTNYEQATRSPLLIAAPGQSATGVSSAPVDLLNLYPTLLDLAAMDRPHVLHGVSLRPILDDPTARVKPVAVSQYQRWDPDAKRRYMGYAFRDERYRYVQWRHTAFQDGVFDGPVVGEELYDYDTDPLETRNLMDDPAYAGELERLRGHAAAYHTEPRVWVRPAE
ncbi:MAG: sulfatase [Planctomycetota bacterium]